MNQPDPHPQDTTETELPWQPITELEIQRALNIAKGTTAPGEDGLPMLV